MKFPQFKKINQNDPTLLFHKVWVIPCNRCLYRCCCLIWTKIKSEVQNTKEQLQPMKIVSNSSTVNSQAWGQNEFEVLFTKFIPQSLLIFACFKGANLMQNYAIMKCKLPRD